MDPKTIVMIALMNMNGQHAIEVPQEVGHQVFYRDQHVEIGVIDSAAESSVRPQIEKPRMVHVRLLQEMEQMIHHEKRAKHSKVQSPVSKYSKYSGKRPNQKLRLTQAPK